MPNKRSALSWPAVVLVPLAFFFASIAATWPVTTDPAHLSVVAPTDNDFRLNIYLIFWGAHALSTNPLGIHQANMFHPEPYSFAYADMLLAHSLLMLPVISSSANPVLTYNLFLLASLTIGASGCFLLARTLTERRSVAFLAAMLWAFNSVHFTRYQQIQLFGDHWLPWLAWALWRWLAPLADTAADRGSPRKAALAAFFFCLNALSGSHIAVYGALLTGLMLAYTFYSSRRGEIRPLLPALLVFVALTVVVLAPLLWPYVALENQMAARRAETLDLPNASLRPYELFSARSRLYTTLDASYGWPSAWLNRSNRELAGYAFPGAIPLILALVGALAAPSGRRRACNFWILYVAGFVFLALGAYGAYALLADVPLLRLIRVPLRFVAPAMLGVAMLGALGVDRLLAPLARRPARVALVGALLVTFAAEASFAPLETWRYEPARHPVTDFLAAEPGDFAIVEFPLEPFSYSVNMRQVFNSIHHWKRLLVGYSGWQSDANIELVRSIRDGFPAAGALDELERLGVRYVIVSLDRVEPAFLDAVARQPRLQAALTVDDAAVFRLAGTAEALQ